MTTSPRVALAVVGARRNYIKKKRVGCIKVSILAMACAEFIEMRSRGWALYPNGTQVQRARRVTQMGGAGTAL